MFELGDPSQPLNLEELRQQGSPKHINRPHFLRLAIVAVLFALVLVFASYAWSIARLSLAYSAQPAPGSPMATESARPLSPTTAAFLVPTTVLAVAPPTALEPTLALPAAAQEGQPPEAAILALGDGLYSHLFIFTFSDGRFTRITAGEWNDIHPALSPDGRRLAFASDRDGYWDLYLLEIQNGQVTRLTDSLEYDASPSWSPDGLWLAYSTYRAKGAQSGDLEIAIRPLDGSQPPVYLTNEPAADHSPAWSAHGRRVAFVSTRSGDADIWLADLDRVDGREINISHSAGSIEAHPAWSPNGECLVWTSASSDGRRSLQVWEANQPEHQPRQINTGDWPVFSPDGKALLTGLDTPNQAYLTGYSLADGSLHLPILLLHGRLNGLAFVSAAVAASLAERLTSPAANAPTPLWAPQYASQTQPPSGRARIVPLVGLDSGEAGLHDGVDESFIQLRLKVAELTGWDFLATLESSYEPLTSALSPGLVENWGYTGRAIRLNTSPVSAGWMALVREDFGAQTYWRIYLRARFQNGLQGAPLDSLPWDSSARHSGDPMAYEAGGKVYPGVPEGYWIDFTRLAAAYGWERVPALSTWRNAFSSARYNEYVLSEGRDWMTAMLEVYPKAALDTPTPVSSPTMTATATNTPQPSATMTRPPYKSRTPTPTLTRRPTSTPTSTNTPRPTRTPTPTVTPKP